MDKRKSCTDLLVVDRKKLQQFRQKKGGRKPSKPGGYSGEANEHISTALEGDRSGSEQCNGDTAVVISVEVAEQYNRDGSRTGVLVVDVRDEAGGGVARKVAEVLASGIKECREEGEDLAAMPMILENGIYAIIVASLNDTVEGRDNDVTSNSSGMVDEGLVTQDLELVSDPMSIGIAEELYREVTGSPSSQTGLEVCFQGREHVVLENIDAGTILLNEETSTPMILENGVKRIEASPKSSMALFPRKSGKIEGDNGSKTLQESRAEYDEEEERFWEDLKKVVLNSLDDLEAYKITQNYVNYSGFKAMSRFR